MYTADTSAFTACCRPASGPSVDVVWPTGERTARL